MLKKFNPSQVIKKLFFKNSGYEQKSVNISGRNYQIRPVYLKDIKDLLSIEREVYAGELPWTKTAFIMELQSPEPHLYLVIQTNEGKIIGFVGCRLYGLDAHITNIAVLNQFQGRGIGSFLIREIKAYALENRCQKLSLEVRISNKNAQRVYRKLGFESKRIKRGYYTENNEDALEMTLCLGKE